MALIKAAAAQTGKPHPADKILWIMYINAYCLFRLECISRAAVCPIYGRAKASAVIIMVGLSKSTRLAST